MTEEEARRFFSAGYTLVLTGGDVITDRRRGISPLYDVYRSGRDVVGWSAADRIVGKAAATVCSEVRIDGRRVTERRCRRVEKRKDRRIRIK